MSIGYTYEEFLNLAGAIAQGDRPPCTGRIMNKRQWFICDTLAFHHQTTTVSNSDQIAWIHYRSEVLATRLEKL